MIGLVWMRLLAQRGARAGLATLLALILLCLAAPLIAPQDPTDPLGFDPAASDHAPSLSWTFLLGADGRGRSVLALLLWGGRATLAIGLGSALLAGAVGLIVGAAGAVCGNAVDAALGRLVDIIQAAPPLLVALVLFAKLGHLSVPVLIMVFAATGWVAPARLTRATVRAGLRADHVQAARATGVTGVRLVCAHLLPDALAATCGWMVAAAATYVALETGLDFLGLGLPADAISWGTALAGAQDELATGNWWWLLSGGMAPALTALALAALAHGLARALDPTAPIVPHARRAAWWSASVARFPRLFGLPQRSAPTDVGGERPSLAALWSSPRPERPADRSPRDHRLLFGIPAAVLIAAAIGLGIRQHGGHAVPLPDAVLRGALSYPSRADAAPYIATASYVAGESQLAGTQIPWAARGACPPELHAERCAQSDVQLWFSAGRGRALAEGGTFVCSHSLTWGLNPMAGMALTAPRGCGVLGPDLRGLGLTAGNVQALLPQIRTGGARVLGQDLVAGRRCWELALPPSGRACIDATGGLVLRLERLDHAGLPVAQFQVTGVSYGLDLASELFANPIPGGRGPLIDGLAQPLLNLQAADDQALFSALVPTFLPAGLMPQTPTFDSFYDVRHSYALEQRVRQAYQDRRGRVALVIIETLPGSPWDDTPPRAMARPVLRAGRHLLVWPPLQGALALVRVETVDTAALVSSRLLPLSVLEQVAAGLQ